MEKVVRDGQVAVLVSPGYGAGWSTWTDYEFVERCLFDPLVVAWVEGGKVGPVPVAQYGEHFYDGGARDLEVHWVPVGSRFRVEEYDGYESLVLESDIEWVTA